MGKLTKTEYLQHLVDEYNSYLRKCVANRTENFNLTPTELAVALARAFEKGAAKAVLYESINDVERIENQTDFDHQKKKEQEEKQRKEMEMHLAELLKAFGILK